MKKIPVLYLVIIICISSFIFGYNYANPAALFWDENYHIASAQKYIDGVFFKEAHPPLGKLFIALGEKLLNPNKNIDKSAFLATDYIKEVPKGYSFVGVRFFPVLFAILSAVLFYLLFYQLLHNLYLALLFSSMYIFENSIIVHSRGAMLDSILIFFVLLNLLWFFTLLNKKYITYGQWFVLGLCIGLAIATKLTGMVLFLLPITLVIVQLKKNSIKEILNVFSYCGVMTVGFLVNRII